MTESDDDDLLTPLERKLIFDEIYNGKFLFNVDDDLFKKNSKKLALERTEYARYSAKLGSEEAAMKTLKSDVEIEQANAKKRKLEAEMKEVELEALKSDFEIKKANAKKLKLEAEMEEFQLAKSKFFYKAGLGENVPLKPYLENICIILGPLLYDFVEDNGGDRLTEDKKVAITRVIKNVLVGNGYCKFLLQALGLLAVNPYNILIPRRNNGQPLAPSSMNGAIQIEAAKEGGNCNFIYAFPFGIATHFPVFFCHPVFADFMDILHDRNANNPVSIEYHQFMINNLNRFKKNLDECLAFLIEYFLDYAKDSEIKFVQKIASAMQKLFPTVKIQEQAQVPQFSNTSSRREEVSNKVKMDATITIKEFPFVILEAKNFAYSINAALQGFQYYGIVKQEFIDNDPCFLITFDRGILYLYGMAKVNYRIVCTCLLSLEFTNNQFNVEGFNDTLYRFVSGLYFFYTKFSSRIQQNLAQDEQHKRYSEIKSAISHDFQPLPAIFSVQSESNPSERIKITFKTVMQTSNDGEIQSSAYFKPCVYLVKTEDGRDAVLKLACNYNIEVHRTLSREQLAPQIIGYEKLWNRYHVILMEYLDSFSYDTVFKYLSNVLIRLNRNHIINSLQDILLKLQSLNLVHGDFRSVNILAKRSENDPSILEDFKLVDFEFSGKLGEPYPFLALKSQKINWPEDFHSYMPRKFEHDQFMLNQIQNNEI